MGNMRLSLASRPAGIMAGLCCFLLMAGCGYRLAGSGRMPAAVESLFIPVFANRSSLTGIENDFTGSLIEEFTRRRGVPLVEEGAAEAVLSGTITSISTATVTHRDAYTSSRRRVRVALKVRLVSRDGRVIWAADDFSQDGIYTVESEKYATDQNLRAAVVKIAGDLAERIYNRLTVDF